MFKCVSSQYTTVNNQIDSKVGGDVNKNDTINLKLHTVRQERRSYIQ